MADSEAVFHQLAAALDYPMFIVTAEAAGARAGCLVGFATQCSIRPVRFVVYLSKKNHTYRVARDASHLGVHVVGTAEHPLAELFGHETGDRIDKLARCRWRPGPGGVPVLEGCRGWFVGRIVDRVDAGDHLGFVLDPVEAALEETFDSVGFQALKGIEPGHDP